MVGVSQVIGSVFRLAATASVKARSRVSSIIVGKTFRQYVDSKPF